MGLLAAAGCDSEKERADLSPALAAEASAYAVEALESTSDDVCVADAFGVDPATARSLADVTVVYAAVLCATKGPAYDEASRVSTVVAVRRGSPASVDWPGDGAEHGPSIERIFPDDLRARAVRGFTEPDGADARLRDRYSDLGR